MTTPLFRLRSLSAPLALLLVVTLMPDGAVAAPAGARTAAGAPVSTTRLPLTTIPTGERTAWAAGAGAAAPACDPTRLPPASTTTVPKGRAIRVNHDAAQVAFGAGAVRTATAIVASSHCEANLPPMDQAMTNVTAAPRRGYRFLPHQTFIEDVTITLPYDPALIPLGLTELDVYTYFYDEVSQTWRALQRVSIDNQAHTVTSLTDHFTDFVNATLTVPDHPETMSYNPNSLKDIKAADPASGIELLAPPQPSNSGNASLNYPITLPPGREDMAPSLGLAYNSAGGNGWLGIG